MAVTAQESNSNLTGQPCQLPESQRGPLRPGVQPLTGSGICCSSHSVSRAKVWRECELGSGHTRTASSTTPQDPVRRCSHGVQTLTCGEVHDRLMRITGALSQQIHRTTAGMRRGSQDQNAQLAKSMAGSRGSSRPHPPPSTSKAQVLSRSLCLVTGKMHPITVNA